MLETKPRAELAGERARNDDAGRRNESDRFTKVRCPDAGSEVSAKVSPIREIERLEDKLDPRLFAKFQRFAKASIKLEGLLPSNIAERYLEAITGAEAGP